MQLRPNRRTLRRAGVILWAGVLAAPSAGAQVSHKTVKIGVLGLFHPTTLVVSPAPGDALTVQACGQTLSVEGSEQVTVRLVEDRLWLEDGGASTACDELAAASRTTGDFVLEVPGKLRRRYRGILTLSVFSTHARRIQPVAQKRFIVAVVAMDLETAVASAVEAESPPHAPQAALEAQAIVARSFYMASLQRHEGFDFCDTTHCQFLREPPTGGAPASVAAANTQGLVLTYRGAVLQAYYSARCGGRTRTLRDEERVGDSYPYYSVDCRWCLRHRSVAANCDTRGYGNSSSHRLGLCQEGATDMARTGAHAFQILAHYYPNTSVTDSRK